MFWSKKNLELIKAETELINAKIRLYETEMEMKRIEQQGEADKRTWLPVFNTCLTVTDRGKETNVILIFMENKIGDRRIDIKGDSRYDTVDAVIRDITEKDAKQITFWLSGGIVDGIKIWAEADIERTQAILTR